jgi:hypothetical protein
VFDVRFGGFLTQKTEFGNVRGGAEVAGIDRQRIDHRKVTGFGVLDVPGAMSRVVKEFKRRCRDPSRVMPLDTVDSLTLLRHG